MSRVPGRGGGCFYPPPTAHELQRLEHAPQDNALAKRGQGSFDGSRAVPVTMWSMGYDGPSVVFRAWLDYAERR